MTELLYLVDSYQTTFGGTVVEVLDDGSVVLDRSAFYPTGGGQPHDTGDFAGARGHWSVTNVTKRGGDTLHVVAGDAGIPQVGETLAGHINWERRYALMRTHSALHVLCGVVFREFGALVTGGNMGEGKARMDFELEDLNPERVAHIERVANEVISDGRAITWRSLPRDEAFQIPDLIRTKINLLPEHITEVRVVEIEGLDLQADGGTHVRNTHEIGGLKVVGTRSKGRINKRLEIELTAGTAGAPEGAG